MTQDTPHSRAQPEPGAAQESATRVTITDLALEAGVSPATVSLALRNKPGVGEGTRRRVLELAQMRGYAPQRRDGRSGAGSRPRQIAVIVKSRPDDRPERNEFYSHVLAGIESVCREQRVHLLWGSVRVDESNYPLEVPLLLEDAVADGLLVVGTWIDASLLTSLRRAGVPMVLVDSYTAVGEVGGNCDSVVTDNRRGGAEAAAHLLELGHTHIALLGTGPAAYPSLRERGEGFRAVVAARESSALPSTGGSVHLVETGPLRGEEDAEATFRSVLRQHPEITACFAANDAIAIGALQAARRARRRVPDDLSLVGFDDILRAEHLIPPLTTLRVDKLKIGRMAAHLLLDRIATPGGASVTTAVQPELILRSSTAPRAKRG